MILDYMTNEKSNYTYLVFSQFQIINHACWKSAAGGAPVARARRLHRWPARGRKRREGQRRRQEAAWAVRVRVREREKERA